MQVSNLLYKFPLQVSERIPWPSNGHAKPYRVWIMDYKTNTPKQVGMMARTLKEIKEKALKFVEKKSRHATEDTELENVSILTIDNTLVSDEEYFRHLPNTEELVMLLPEQSCNFNIFSQQSSGDDNSCAELSVVKRKTTAGLEMGKNDFRYFVPTPEGEVARLTIDIYKEQPAESGCVRLTAATTGNAGVAVSYEIKLNGLRTIVHYTLRWSAVVLTNAGRLLVSTGELLKNYLQ